MSDTYIPALGYNWLTPLYDPVMRWVMRELTFKRSLVRSARIRAGFRVLDLGCGTGTLTILIKQQQPAVSITGLDGDRRVLDIGRDKARRAGVGIAWVQGLAFELPFPDSSFDRVLSSLVLHHLTRENKQHTLREVFRVLKPGGEVHIIDLGRPHTGLTSAISLVTKRFEETADNIAGLLPVMLHRAGFQRVEETAHYTTIVGTLSLYQARKVLHEH